MKLYDWLIIILIILFCWIIWFWMAIGYQVGQGNALEVPLNQFYTINSMYLKAVLPPYHLETNELGYRIVTAYNPVPNQTDNTPCISASGMNICEIQRNIIATNEFAFGTLLMIDGKVWEVQDRTNKRYSHRIDLLMYDYQEAKNWGKRTLKIDLVN